LDFAHTFSEGLAGAGLRGKAGFVDRTGKFVIEPKFDGVWEFSEGLAKVMLGEFMQGEKYGYVDKTGKFMINPVFDGASSFSEGLAEVWLDGKAGYVDKTGRYVVHPQ
jgi:hypothetical protein